MTVGEVVTSALDDDEMIHVAARSFGLDIEGGDKAAALAAIELFLHEEARNGRRTLLIVDEAQNLSIGALEELRMLSNFQLGSHPLLQTLLLGQPEFKHLLAHSDELEQLRQRVIAAHHLEPMQPGEIEPYVMHRLAMSDGTAIRRSTGHLGEAAQGDRRHSAQDQPGDDPACCCSARWRSSRCSKPTCSKR